MKRAILLIAIFIALVSACSMPFNTNQDETRGTDSQSDQPSETQSEKRCGDGVCDGPENTQNCPQDCTSAAIPSSKAEDLQEDKTMDAGDAPASDQGNPEAGYRYVSFSGTVSTSLNTAAMGDFTGTAFEYGGEYRVELWFPIEGGEAVQQRNSIALTEFRDLYYGDTSCTPCEWALDDNAFEPVSFTMEASLNLNAVMEDDQTADELVYQLAELPQAVITGVVQCPCPGSAPDDFSDPAAYLQTLGWFMQKLANPIHLNVLEINSVESFAISPMGFVNIPKETLSYTIVPDLKTP